MRNSINRYQLLFNIFAATALLALSANPAYADSDSRSSEDSLSSEVSGGFCDCSTTGDLVCHIPPGNRANMHTIQVGSPAIDAHLAHGDMLGVCPGEAYEADEYHNSHASADEVCVCEDGDIGKLYHVPVPAEPAAKNMREIIGK